MAKGDEDEQRTLGGEMLSTLAVGLQASAVTGEVAGVSIVVAGGPSFAVDTLIVDSRVT